MASDERDEAEEGYGCCGSLLVSASSTHKIFMKLNLYLYFYD